MRYLMLVCVDPSGEPFDPARDNVEEWVSTNDKKGTRIMGNPDGPFAETREWIGGFDLLDCASLDAAIEIASKHPMARFGAIEVRPLRVDG
jgi:hypothetical protein